MPVRWGDAEEKRLLLLLLDQASSSLKPDLGAIIAAWPTDPRSHGLSGIPTKDSLSKRVNALRREATDAGGGVTGDNTVATAPAPRHLTSRPSQRVKSQGSTDEISKAEDDEGSAAGSSVVATSQSYKKSVVKKDSKKGNFRIKFEKDANAAATISTPTSRAMTTGILTPSTTNGGSTSSKRKRSSTTIPDASESEEAQSTNATEDSANEAADPDSPTPKVKQPRMSYSRASKVHQVSYVQLDGLSSSEDEEVLMAGSKAAAGAEYARVLADLKKARERSKVVPDDDDEEYFASDLEFMA